MSEEICKTMCVCSKDDEQWEHLAQPHEEDGGWYGASLKLHLVPEHLCTVPLCLHILWLRGVSLRGANWRNTDRGVCSAASKPENSLRSEHEEEEVHFVPTASKGL